MEWIKVFGSLEEANSRLAINRPQLLIIRHKRICLVRMNEGWRAVEDTCSHNGESLSKGAVNFLGEIICPWHGYRFQLTTGRECSERCRDLVTYPIRQDSNGLFLGL